MTNPFEAAMNTVAQPFPDNGPAHTVAEWKDGRVINRGALPLWSGKRAPPKVGEVVVCADRKGTRVTVTGDLAGAELL